MNRLWIAPLFILLLVGCAKSDGPAPEPVAKEGSTAGTKAPAGSGDGIRQLGPNVGGITPVTGTESLDGGGGSGPADVVKQRAKSVASGQSSAPAPDAQTDGN